MALPLELPTLQNWSCHNCGGCCRQHAIEITAEEKARIESQQWDAADSPLRGQPLFVRSGWPWNRTVRLAHQADGGCVFLDEQGLCRIHGKFGEPAKPLACRVYPYAFHPAGKKIVLSLRFSCPSVVSNRGRPVRDQQRDLKELERLIVPENASSIPPPPVSPGQRISWPDLLTTVSALDRLMAEPEPVLRRLLRLELVARLLGQAKFDKISGARVTELMDLLIDASGLEVGPDLNTLAAPSSAALTMFRMLCAQLVRKDTAAISSSGWWHRVWLVRSAIRFARGRGQTPVLQAGLKEVSFADLADSYGPIPPDAEELLTRYVRVKLQGLHFCGRAYYDVPLVEGLQALLLAVAVILWTAKWHARSQDRRRFIPEDIAWAIAAVDHNQGYHPALGQRTQRARTRLLAKHEEIPKLLAWSGR